jgi:hypothetical protein
MFFFSITIARVRFAAIDVSANSVVDGPPPGERCNDNRLGANSRSAGGSWFMVKQDFVDMERARYTRSSVPVGT